MLSKPNMLNGNLAWVAETGRHESFPLTPEKKVQAPLPPPSE